MQSAEKLPNNEDGGMYVREGVVFRHPLPEMCDQYPLPDDTQVVFSQSPVRSAMGRGWEGGGLLRLSWQNQLLILVPAGPGFDAHSLFPPRRNHQRQQIAATKGGGVVGQQQKQQQPSMVTIFGSGIPSRTLAEIAEVRSACRLWSWIARIEALAAMAVTTAADRRRPGAGAGVGIGIGG